MNNVITHWDELFMRVALTFAMKSKDPSSQLGAVLVKDRRIISAGYNGIPKGVFDPFDYKFLKRQDLLINQTYNTVKKEDLFKRWERPEKYKWFEHSERNAIYNAAKVGIATEGSTMYTNGVPCCDCARAIIQSGVLEVVVHKTWVDLEGSGGIGMACQNHDTTRQMFEEANVYLKYFDKKLGITLLQGEKEIEL